jgi:hypothetical protein
VRYDYPFSVQAPQPSASVVNYINPFSSQDATWTTAGSRTQRTMIVTAPFQMRSFSVRLTTAPGVGNSRTFSICRNDNSSVLVSTGLTITISGTDTTGSVTGIIEDFTFGDLVAIKSEIAGTPAAAGIVDMWGTCRASGIQQIHSNNSTAVSNATPTFNLFQGCYAVAAEPTEADAEQIIPCAGTISMANFRTPAGAPGAGTQYDIVLRKNGADTAITGTISGTSSSATDYVDSVTVAAGDRVCWKITPTGTPTARAVSISCNFTPDNPQNSIMCFALQGNSSTSAERFVNPLGRGSGAYGSVRADVDTPMPASVTISHLYARVGTAPGAAASGKKWRLRSMIDSSYSGPDFDILETATSNNNGTDSSATTDGQNISFSILPTNTPAGNNGLNMGMLLTMPLVEDGIVDLCSAELGTSSAPYYGGSQLISGTCSVSSSNPRTGTYSYRVNPTTTGTGYFECYGADIAGSQTAYGHNIDDAYYCAHIYVAAAPAANDEEIAVFYNTAGSAMASLRLTSAMKIDLYSNNLTTKIGTGTTVLSTNTYYRIELRLKSSTGAYELRIRDASLADAAGTTEYSGTGATIGSLYNAKARWGKATDRNGQSIDVYYDDLWVADTGFGFTSIGYKVQLCLPDGNGWQDNWSVSGDYTAIDEIPPDNSDYQGEKSANSAFYVTLANAVGASTVKAVKHIGFFVNSISTFTSSARLVSTTNSGTSVEPIPGTVITNAELPVARVINRSESGSAMNLAMFNGLQVGAIVGLNTYGGSESTDHLRCTWMGTLAMFQSGSANNNLLLLGVA